MVLKQKYFKPYRDEIILAVVKIYKYKRQQ